MLFHVVFVLCTVQIDSFNATVVELMLHTTTAVQYSYGFDTTV